MENKNNNSEVMKVGEFRTFGNYRVSHEKDGDGRWVVCSSVQGDWKVSWRDDNMMYGVLLSYTKDSSCGAYVNDLLRLMHLATSHNHDAATFINGDGTPFMDGFSRLWNEQVAYELSLEKPVSRKADERMLGEAVEMESLREDMKDLIDDAKNG